MRVSNRVECMIQKVEFLIPKDELGFLVLGNFVQQLNNTQGMNFSSSNNKEVHISHE
jgi:hypothetical protein